MADNDGRRRLGDRVFEPLGARVTPADVCELEEYDDDVERAELAAMRLRRDARRGRRNGAADVKGPRQFKRADKGADALYNFRRVTK